MRHSLVLPNTPLLGLIILLIKRINSLLRLQHHLLLLPRALLIPLLDLLPLTLLPRLDRFGIFLDLGGGKGRGGEDGLVRVGGGLLGVGLGGVGGGAVGDGLRSGRRMSAGVLGSEMIAGVIDDRRAGWKTPFLLVRANTVR